MLESEISGAGRLHIQYGNVAKPLANNDNCVFTETQVAEIRRLLRPYMDGKLLKDFGFTDASQKTLAIQYATSGFTAVELRKKTSGCSKPYEIRVYGHCGIFDAVHPEYTGVKEALRNFLRVAFPGHEPRFSVV